MPLAQGTAWRDFQVTADTTDVMAGDALLGSRGRGRWKIWALAAAAADGTISIEDGAQTVINAVPIPVRAAAVTFPEVKMNEDLCWIVDYTGESHPVITIVDGTNAEVIVRVMYIGRR